MADCSELEKLLMEVAMNLAAQKTVTIKNREFEIGDLDDVVVAMQSYFPEIRRNDLVDAITNATKKNAKEVDETTQLLRNIRNEARGNKRLEESIQELNEYLETGQVPVKKQSTKETTAAILQLRNTRNTLRQWLETSDPVMKERLANKLDRLNKKIESGDISVKQTNRGALHQEAQAIQDEIDAAQKQIREMRAGPELTRKIEALQKHLEKGTLPPTKKPNTAETRANDDLRTIIKELRAKLRMSDPAKRERLEASINRLEETLDEVERAKKEGRPSPLIPKPKPTVTESKEIQDLIYRRDLLRNEIRKEILNLAPAGFWTWTARGWDFVRAMMTTGEFSFALRQGGIYAFTHPVKWSKAMVNAFKSFVSGKKLHQINKGIFERPNGYLYQASGLVLIQEGMALTETEEVMMNYWADKAWGIRNFNRAAIGFMNTLRADLFDAGRASLSRTGEMTQNEAEIWANYINVMSGRGNLGRLEPAALAMNRTFFSARYVASRFQLLTGMPVFRNLGKGSARVRGMVAREYARLGMSLFSIFSLAIMVGFDVEPDPRSPDFAKLKLGSRRLDVLMGHQQIIRFMASMMTGVVKSSSGDLRPIHKKWAFFTDDKIFETDPNVPYGGRDARQVMFNFVRSKASPQLGLAIDFFTGSKYNGEEVDLVNTAGQVIYPITYGDIYDVMQEDGIPENVALSVLAFLGMGLQTYDQSEKRIRIR